MDGKGTLAGWLYKVGLTTVTMRFCYTDQWVGWPLAQWLVSADEHQCYGYLSTSEDRGWYWFSSLCMTSAWSLGFIGVEPWVWISWPNSHDPWGFGGSTVICQVHKALSPSNGLGYLANRHHVESLWARRASLSTVSWLAHGSFNRYHFWGAKSYIVFGVGID